MIQDLGVLLVSHPDPGFLGGLPLEDVHGRPLIERILQQTHGWDRVRRGRVAKHRSLHGAIALVATDHPDDAPLCEWADSIDLPYLRSSQAHPADRVAEAADFAGFQWVAPIDPRDAILNTTAFEAAARAANVGIDLITNRDALGIATWPVELVRTSAIDADAIGSIAADGLWGTELEKARDITSEHPSADVRIRSRDDLHRLRAFAEAEVTDWAAIPTSAVTRWFSDPEFEMLRAAA